MDLASVRYLVNSSRFVEALYFGALLLSRQPSAELHLLLGLACCGAVKPIAASVRMLQEPDADYDPALAGGGLIVGANTSMVREGFFHMIEALRAEPEIKFAVGTQPAVSDVLKQMSWYMRQEFHGFDDARKPDLRSSAAAAALLLYRLGGSTAPLSPLQDREGAEAAIAQWLRMTGGDAAFSHLPEPGA